MPGMALGIGCHTLKNTDHVPTPQSLILVEKADTAPPLKKGTINIEIK